MDRHGVSIVWNCAVLLRTSPALNQCHAGLYDHVTNTESETLQSGLPDRGVRGECVVCHVDAGGVEDERAKQVARSTGAEEWQASERDRPVKG